ncbi:MAG TPA: hypothetical protein VGX28_01495 [Frankiaceae bacterium]|jgi:hypothetical protein|nr:hypothetical protein [Frankiaceae bacterium]
MNARRDAMLRVRGLHPPLPALFALLRGTPPPEAAPDTAPDTAPVAGVEPADPADPADSLDEPLLAGFEAARAAGVPVGEPDLDAARALAAGDPARARNAAVVASASAAPGWEAYQRFGDPWCPSPGCYGRDGAPLTGTAPPFAEDCNCSAEPRRVR